MINLKVKVAGNVEEFDKNWREREETTYNHWSSGAPQNQVQLAFRCHWEVFNELIGPRAKNERRCLEVGAGRGSLSNYFADNGWDATLLDSSAAVLEVAKKSFSKSGHSAQFITGDANNLPFPDNSFDVTTSIGLLEHFEDVRTPIAEQLRVLKPGGWFFGYIVPERPDNIQRYFNWLNGCLKVVSGLGLRSKARDKPAKEPVYRSDSYSDHYIRAIDGLKLNKLTTFGMYPLPLISHSPEFPFTLLPKPLELVLTQVFRAILATRSLLTGRHGWICSERLGQAFLLAFKKPEE